MILSIPLPRQAVTYSKVKLAILTKYTDVLNLFWIHYLGWSCSSDRALVYIYSTSFSNIPPSYKPAATISLEIYSTTTIYQAGW